MRSKCTTAAIAATLVCGLGSSAFAADSADLAAIKNEMAQLRASNAQLQTQVGQLQGNQQENWLNERRAEEVKGLVREVLADADVRSSMAEGGMTAGYNKKFFLASEDGKFLLNVQGQVQFRYIMNSRPDTTGDDYEAGFQLRRTKLKFNGHVGNPKIGYQTVIAFDRNTGTGAMEEAQLSYKLADNLKLVGGRYKNPFMREELTSSSAQMAVERSYFNETFTTGFAEGVGLEWNASDAIKVAVMFNDGDGSGEVSTTKDFHNDSTDFGAGGRVDFKLAGDWGQMKDFTSWAGEDFAAFIGAGLYYERAESGVNTNYHYGVNYTIDASIESKGLSIFGALSGYNYDGDNGNGDNDAIGAMAQIAYMVVPDKFEPFARMEYMLFNGSDETKLATVGFNYYLAKHNAKFTGDVVWAMDPINGSSGLGLLGDTGNQDNQMAVRVQFQLLF